MIWQKTNQWSPDAVRSALYRIYGFRTFRENQESIVNALLNGRDTVAVMPTGSGKSLCYQLPAHLLDGTCVVVSPLIALMKDQVDAADRTGLSAAFINSSQSSDEQLEVVEKIQNNELDLLYASPERLVMKSFRQILENANISFFAIDEAHCISEWGHDFRPDYYELGSLIQQFPAVHTAAFTATATLQVQKDIIKRLHMRKPHVVRASFDRPNLFYSVQQKQWAEEQILTFVRGYRGETGIVYRLTRNDVEQTAEYLKAGGVSVLPYHAGMPNGMRRKNQEAFISGKTDVVVATIAFGMGIDKPDVRFVVHGDLPKNLESYYQETGRAGRDGKMSHCLLLYGRKDISRLKYFIFQVKKAKDRQRLFDQLESMSDFADAGVCRRSRLLAYFGEAYTNGNCGGCDICRPTGPGKGGGSARSVLTETIERTWHLLQQGHSCSEIAAIRGLKSGTINTHIEQLIRDGRAVDLDLHVPPQTQRYIASFLQEQADDRLTPIVEASGGTVTYNEARLVRAYLNAAGDHPPG